MQFVFQGETGGFLSFPIPTTVDTQPVSGYIDIVGAKREAYRIDGSIYTQSGQLSELRVLKEHIVLNPGSYTVLPQVYNTSNKVYYLDPCDLNVKETPDFFPTP